MDTDRNSYNNFHGQRDSSNNKHSMPQNGHIHGQNDIHQNNCGTAIRQGQDSGYEEFLGGSTQCPSCRGTGRIPRESENELLALIPVSDKRFKPRRTTLYVILSIIICCSIAGLLVFFLYPRGFSITSDSKNLIPSLLYINITKSFVEMTITSSYNITNPNFFSMEITEISGQVFFDQHIMAKAKNTTVLHVPMRSKREHFLTFDIKFEGDEGYIAYYCSTGSRFGHTILMPFEAKLNTVYMGRKEMVSVTTYERVKCSKNLVHTTTKKPATTTKMITIEPVIKS